LLMLTMPATQEFSHVKQNKPIITCQSQTKTKYEDG